MLLTFNSFVLLFLTTICRDIEVNSLLQYVVNQLNSGESLDLLVLKELLTTMTGVQAVFDVSDGQLDALAGSETLRNEVITQVCSSLYYIYLSSMLPIK